MSTASTRSQTGLAMLPVTLVTGTTAYLSSRAIAQFGEWPVMTAGLTTGAIGAALVAVDATRWRDVTARDQHDPARVDRDGDAGDDRHGNGRRAQTERVGLASGVLNAARQTGGAFGIAVLGALLRVSGHIEMHTVDVVIAGAYAIGAAFAVNGRHVRNHPAAQTTIPGAQS